MRGFTLIELTLFFVIIGILTSAAIPLFRSYQPNLKLSAVIRDLIGDIRYAQQLAVTEQIEYSICFYPDDKKYEIIRQEGAPIIIKTVFLPEEISEMTVDGLEEFGDCKEARYNPYGAVREAGLINLKNEKNITKGLDIRPSGFVKTITY